MAGLKPLYNHYLIIHKTKSFDKVDNANQYCYNSAREVEKVHALGMRM
jgi:hypothetical protein